MPRIYPPITVRRQVDGVFVSKRIEVPVQHVDTSEDFEVWTWFDRVKKKTWFKWEEVK